MHHIQFLFILLKIALLFNVILTPINSQVPCKYQSKTSNKQKDKKTKIIQKLNIFNHWQKTQVFIVNTKSYTIFFESFSTYEYRFTLTSAYFESWLAHTVAIYHNEHGKYNSSKFKNPEKNGKMTPIVHLILSVKQYQIQHEFIQKQV